MARSSKNHDHVQKIHHTQRAKTEFRGVNDAIARLVHFGAILASNGNVYIEKRVGLKVLGAVDYVNNTARGCGHGPYAVFGKAPA